MRQFFSNLLNLYAYRELLWVWTLRDIKIRYKQSVLGTAWAILQPLSLMVMFSIIFSLFVRIPTEGFPYPIFSYIALLPWTFFSTSITFAVPSLIQNMNLVTKIYFPREILPISAVLAGLVDFSIACLVFIGLLFYYDIHICWAFMFLPVVLGIQILLTLGIVLITSAVNVFYRDVRFIVPLAIQLWMYSTPIIYPIDLVPKPLQKIYLLNPMAVIIESYRSITLRGVLPDLGNFAIAVGVSTALFIAGYLYFKHVEWQFADLI